MPKQTSKAERIQSEMCRKAAARIQSAAAKPSSGGVSKESFAARAQSAAARNSSSTETMEPEKSSGSNDKSRSN